MAECKRKRKENYMADLKTPLHINMPEKKIADYDRDIKMFDQDDSSGTMINQILMQCNETEEAFIFSYIKPFVDSISEIEISKEELVEAILLNRLKKEAIKKYGYHVLSNDLTTATAQMQYLRDGYRKGYDAGYNRAREECIQFMSQDLKENSR
jgi:hypothetical protein